MSTCIPHRLVRGGRESGFTLVELAIVLMIIGLLIGGILRGQEMMATARLQATIKQITSYVGVINTFQDTYGAKPGDFHFATSRLSGCTAVNGCYDGNGNGTVGVPTTVWEGGTPFTAINTENAQFWKHLSMSHMITGIKPLSTTIAWGETFPVAPLANGGFTVVTSAGAGVASIMQGALVLRMHGSLNGNVEITPVTSPKHSAYIDRKMDDGKPQTGDVQTRAYGNGAAVAMCEDVYTAEENAFCVMSFLMNK